MIRPLRQRHRMTFLALIVIIPAIYFAGLSARPAVPKVKRVPGPLQKELPVKRIASQPARTIDTAGLQLNVYENPPTESIRWLIVLKPKKFFKSPDIIVYWSENRSESLREIPADSYLLGTLSGEHEHQYLLPSAANGNTGHVVLYSLAHRKIIHFISLAGGVKQKGTPDES